ncbi:MAG: sialidase family protein [Polyangiaceae bacterium]|nr:sialidase family protein [Polyangiaceae bacterium]
MAGPAPLAAGGSPPIGGSTQSGAGGASSPTGGSQQVGGAGGGSAQVGAGGTASSSGTGGNGGSNEPSIPGGVPMVLGVGSGFLTMVSCDDGRTWREGRAVPGGNCANDGDCSHDPGRALGLAYSNGWFVAPFGNEGNDTQIRRTRDGLHWERVYDQSTGGMAVGNGRIVANSRPALYSDDDGATWKKGAPFDTFPGANNARAAFFAPYGGGRFLLHYDTGGARDMVVSTDGINFSRPLAYPQACSPSGLAYGNGVFVMTTNDGHVCRSDDGGVHWTGPLPLKTVGASTPTDNLRTILWTGSEFIAYHWNDGFRSQDGVTWTSVTISPGGAHIETNVRTLSGAWVTARQGNNAAFATSNDGLSWTDAPGTSNIFIHQFVAGYALPAGCPSAL